MNETNNSETEKNASESVATPMEVGPVYIPNPGLTFDLVELRRRISELEVRVNAIEAAQKK